MDLLAMFRLGIGFPGAHALTQPAALRPAARAARTAFTSPGERARIAGRMAAKGSTPAGLEWFLSED